MKTALLFFLCILLFASVSPAQPIPLAETALYNFIHPRQNIISNLTSLDPFYKKLAALKKKGKGQVRIVHLGDSHIQADLLTAPVRTCLQAFFGNAGRGLVFPYQLARSNR